MPIASYAALVSAVTRWAGNSSDPDFAAAVLDAIGLCEARVNREVRAPEMVVRATAALNEEFESLPDDLIKLISITLSDGGVEYPLRQVPSERLPPLYWQALAEPRPRWFSLQGFQVRLLPVPTGGAIFTARVVYYGKVQPLADSTSCTAMLAAYPDLYLFGALSYLGEYIEDQERLARFEGRYQQAAVAATVLSVTRDATLAA